MRCSDTLRLSLRLVAHMPGRAFIVAGSIALGTMLLWLFLSFASGVENAVLQPILERSSPKTLIVRPQYRSLDFITGGNKLTEQVIRRVEDLPGVEQVGRQLFLGFPNSLEVSLFGLVFDSDVPVFGVDASLLNDAEASTELSDPERLPLAISPHLIDLFNSSFADSLPGVSALGFDDALGKDLTLIFGRSSFFNLSLSGAEPVRRTAEVTTISPKVPPMGVSIPLETALELNQQIGGVEPTETVYQQLYVEVATLADIDRVQAAIDDLGYSARSFEELGEEVRLLTDVVRLVLALAGGVVLLIAFFSLSALISVIILEQRRSIGVLRALGESRFGITRLFLGFAAILTFSGALIGIGLGILLGRLADSLLARALPDIAFFAVDFFPFSLTLLGGLLASVLLATVLFAGLPVRRAGRQPILGLLWK